MGDKGEEMAYIKYSYNGTSGGGTHLVVELLIEWWGYLYDRVSQPQHSPHFGPDASDAGRPAHCRVFGSIP